MAPTLALTSWNFLLLFYVGYILCSVLDYNVPSDLAGEAQFSLPLEEGRDKTVKRRQVESALCAIPPPMTNGKYRPSKHRCPPNNRFPACQMIEGTLVSNWPIFLDYCNPGYVANTKVSVCVEGSWSPELPTCEVCPPSDTLVNGKPVCKGDVVFEDNFSGPLSRKWSHSTFFGKIALKFNEFTADSKNSFTRNGSLVIKPTVHHESYLTSGTVVLDRCTSAKREICERTGSPDNILPPVATAALHTFDSFSFTYGEVEIRAKLPKGDWLKPALRLRPKQDFYGDGETSGRVSIGETIGNSDLRCGTEDYGLGRVDYEVYIKIENKQRYMSFTIPNVSENWHNDFHTYNVMWKPGSITFKVDNELVGELAPAENQTLCEMFGFTKEDCMVYSKGSKLAPYDKDFYIQITLVAGDFGTVMDDCINRGKVKPWKYDDTQATLKFWQDRQNWLSTWTEEGSSLYIDYVRVTAV